MKKPGKLFKKDLEHPKDQKSAFNGDKIRPQESQGFMQRRAAQGLGEAYSSNYVSPKSEVVNGLYQKIDPKSTEVTGRTCQKPPTSLAVGGHERGRHVPERNAPSHYSPGYQRPRGAPQTSELTLRQEGTDGN